MLAAACMAQLRVSKTRIHSPRRQICGPVRLSSHERPGEADDLRRLGRSERRRRPPGTTSVLTPPPRASSGTGSSGADVLDGASGKGSARHRAGIKRAPPSALLRRRVDRRRRRRRRRALAEQLAPSSPSRRRSAGAGGCWRRGRSTTSAGDGRFVVAAARAKAERSASTPAPRTRDGGRGGPRRGPGSLGDALAEPLDRATKIFLYLPSV